MTKKVSLAEIMGKSGAEHCEGMSLDHLPEILGEAMPELPKNPVGRYRLLRSLKARFGPNFRSLPCVMGLLKEFDEVVDVEKKVAQIRNVKVKHG